MSVYFAFLIPFFVTGALVFIWPRRVHITEIGIPILFSLALIFGAKSCAVKSLTWDTEYLGGHIKAAEHYEHWNEYIHRTCSYTTCSGSGKTRSCTTHYYDCSYVKDHPEHWMESTTLGDFSITQERYNQLCKQFGTPITFRDLHRHYHSIDGDMHYCNWSGSVNTVEPVTTSNPYENRPQAALNVFHYDELDSSDVKRYRLYEYPGIQSHNQQTYLGDSRLPYAVRKRLDYFNGVIAPSKQARVFVLVFEDLPRQAGFAQETYWANGNKNELVVCIGKQGQRITWCHVFSWTEVKSLVVSVRNDVQSLSSYDPGKIVDITTAGMTAHWKRKSFKEFDYLSVEPTPRQTFWIFFWTVVFNLGLAFFIYHFEPKEAFNGDY